MKILVTLIFNGNEETLEAINKYLCESIRKDFIDEKPETVCLWEAKTDHEDEEDYEDEEE